MSGWVAAVTVTAIIVACLAATVAVSGWLVDLTDRAARRLRGGR